MILKKTVLMLFVVLASSIFTFAQDNNAATISLLDQVSSKLSKATSLQIDFNFSSDNKQKNKKENYTGSALYKAGLYKLDLMGQVVYSDGKTNWTYLKDAEEVNITTVDNANDILINPKGILANYKNEYKVKQISDRFENNRAIVTIDLYPKQVDKKKFSRLTLKVDKTAKRLYSIVYVGKDGLSFTITITKYLENLAIQDKDIKYSDSLYPNAEVIDMR